MDTGLNTLITIAHFHQLPAEPEQIAHQFARPGQPFGDTELLQAAKALTLKARKLKPSLADLDNSILPAIARLKDGSYIILARVARPDSQGDQPQGQTGVLVHEGETVTQGQALIELDATRTGDRSGTGAGGNHRGRHGHRGRTPDEDRAR